MNWKTIIKEDTISKKKRDRREKASARKDKRSTPVPLVGNEETWDNPDYMQNADINDMEEDRLQEADLAEMTRQDLIKVATEWIESLDEDSLMELLVGSLGQIDISSISYEDKNNPLA
jgi:hypothetical protein